MRYFFRFYSVFHLNYSTDACCCTFVNDRNSTIYYLNFVSINGSSCFQLLAPRTAETGKVCSNSITSYYTFGQIKKQINRTGLQLSRFSHFVAGFSRVPYQLLWLCIMIYSVVFFINYTLFAHLWVNYFK